MTPHISAKIKDIAKIVIMPGDPKRAKYIAETFLENAVCINEVRGMLGFTGTYKGKKITVMGSGMGMPSMGIYSYELFNIYDVNTIIRVGSMGAYNPNLKLYDTILVTNSYSESTYAYIQNGYQENFINPTEEINQIIEIVAKDHHIELIKGTIHSSDVFYGKTDYVKLNKEKNCLGVEMESFALFHNAKVLNKKAACLLTVSDIIKNKKETTIEEREKSFNNMIILALESTLKITE